MITHRQHVGAISLTPAVRVRFKESTGQFAGNAVEANELANAVALVVVLFGAAVQSQHDRRYVAENRRAHQR